MNRIRVFSVAVLVAGALACAAFAIAQSQANSARVPELAVERTRDSRLIGVKVVRLLNTAEMNYRSAHGAYADWDELYRSGEFAETQKHPAFAGLGVSAGPEVVPGWNLTMIASADRRSYELSLRNVDDKECRFSFFTDESGLIYEGDVIGCPAGRVIPARE
ncbi:MAG: hypothetical protein WBE20_14225 [Candidatus Acidiferrales bacterium]